MTGHDDYFLIIIFEYLDSDRLYPYYKLGLPTHQSEPGTTPSSATNACAMALRCTLKALKALRTVGTTK